MSDNGRNVCAQTLPDRVNLVHLVGVESLGDETQELLIRLDLYTEAIFRTSYRGGQPVSHDEVSPLDLAQALIGLDAGTGVLPPNVLFCCRGGEERIGIYLPPECRALRLAGEPEPLMVPTPPLVFAGRGKSYYVFALGDDDWPTAETALCRAPFPNVYFDGRICPGSVKFPRLGLETVHESANLFLASEFNRDLVGGKSQERPNDVTALWRALDTRRAEAYPASDLVSAGMTLGEMSGK